MKDIIGKPELEDVIEGFVNVILPTKRDLGMTFLRPEEHYESDFPKFRGKIFTFDEFKDYWKKHSELAKENNGRFVYCQWYDGFNIPSHALTPFYQGRFNPLSEREINLLDLLTDRKKDIKYVIGTKKMESRQYCSMN